MTTITFEVPTEQLRQFKAQHVMGESMVEFAARSAIAMAQAGLPPPRIPVTKDTRWGTPIIGPGNRAVFVAPHPINADQFIGFYPESGLTGSLVYGHWYEVVSEPEPAHVPVEVGGLSVDCCTDKSEPCDNELCYRAVRDYGDPEVGL